MTDPATPGAFELAVSASGSCALRGSLVFATARAAHVAGLKVIEESSAQELEFDLSGLTRSDSAGLVVLVDWLAAARRCGRNLRYAAVPAGLLALAAISELQGLLTAEPHLGGTGGSLGAAAS